MAWGRVAGLGQSWVQIVSARALRPGEPRGVETACGGSSMIVSTLKDEHEFSRMRQSILSRKEGSLIMGEGEYWEGCGQEIRENTAVGKQGLGENPHI